MNSNSFIYGLQKVGTLVQLTGAAWPATAPACVCRLHAVAGRPAALVSDKSALEACTRDDALYKSAPLTFMRTAAQYVSTGPTYFLVSNRPNWYYHPVECRQTA